MRIAVPKETAPGERRVALVPESCKKLIQAGYEISVESGAGEAAGFADAAYRELGVDVEPDPAALDRKSTRLNSSHGYISYAVFCLKKKKKTHRELLLNSAALSRHRGAQCPQPAPPPVRCRAAGPQNSKQRTTRPPRPSPTPCDGVR